MSASSRRVTLAVFSSIPDIVPSLQKAAPNLDLEVIEDAALGGYGGTVNFDPQQLSEASRQRLSKAEALIAEPSVLAQILQDNPQAFPSLQWCQSTYAGVDPLFDAGLELPLHFTLTRFAGKFGPPIAEWSMARIIGHERNFALSADDQRAQLWAGSRQVTRYRYLKDLTLTILGGAGDIGLCIGRAAQAFGMRVVGFGKTPRHPNDRHPNDLPGLDDYTTDLAQALEQGDYIVSVLPSTPHTRGLLSGDILASAKGAVFLNVGRGDIISEEFLVKALDQGYVSAAILDVFATEPLPKESLLWGRKDVVVSPHVSGVTRAEDVPGIVLENYRRFTEGEELLYKVDWSKGY